MRPPGNLAVRYFLDFKATSENECHGVMVANVHATLARLLNIIATEMRQASIDWLRRQASICFIQAFQ